MEKNGYVDVLHKMVYIYFMKKMYKFKICLVKNGVHLFLRRSSTGIRNVYGSHLPNLICIWFIECLFRWGALVDLRMGFHEHFYPCLLLLGENFSLCFLALILMFVTSLVGNSYPF